MGSAEGSDRADKIVLLGFDARLVEGSALAPKVRGRDVAIGAEREVAVVPG